MTSSLPTCQHFEKMAFLYEKTANMPIINNIAPSSTILSENSTQFQSNSIPNVQTDISQVEQQNQSYSPAVANFDLQSPNRVSNESGFSFPPSPASSTLSNSSKRKRKLSTEADNSGANAVIQHLHNIEKELRTTEQEECEDLLFCRSLVPTLKRLSAKKNKMGNIKISQLLFEHEFDEECI